MNNSEHHHFELDTHTSPFSSGIYLVTDTNTHMWQLPWLMKWNSIRIHISKKITGNLICIVPVWIVRISGTCFRKLLASGGLFGEDVVVLRPVFLACVRTFFAVMFPSCLLKNTGWLQTKQSKTQRSLLMSGEKKPFAASKKVRKDTWMELSPNLDHFVLSHFVEPKSKSRTLALKCPSRDLTEGLGELCFKSY